MSEDPRCCGSGTCIIDAEGRCWCGQHWDGEKMCHAQLASSPATAPASGTGVLLPGNAHDQKGLQSPAA